MADIEPQPIQALLDYQIAQESGVIVKRQVIEHLAQRQSYGPTEQVRINWTSGGSMVFGPTSRLEFNLEITGNNNAVLRNSVVDNVRQIGHGVHSSIIRDSKLRVGSVQIYDENFVGIRTDANDLMSCSKTYLQNTGTMMGYFDKPIGINSVVNERSRFSALTAGRQEFSVSIPLHHIAGFWGQPLLIPFGIMSGEAEMELILQNVIEAIHAPGGGANYVVTDVRLQLDTITLADEVMQQILAVRDVEGVPYSFDTFVSSVKTFTAANKQTIELNQNVSRALTAFARLRPASRDIQAGEDALSMSDYNAVIQDWRFRLGSTFYPENTSVLNPAQSYAETLKAYNNLQDCSRPPGLDFEEYIQFGHVIGVDLQRDPGVSEDGASGISTKANRNLVLEITLKVPAFTDTKVFLYLHYEKALKILGNQILVST